MIIGAKALSRKEMEVRKEEMLARSDVVVISIINPEDDFIFYTSRNYIKSYKCHDIEPTSVVALSQQYEPMMINQGKHIFELIREYDNKDEEFYLYVNCSAGVCRSGAVVEFVRRYVVLDPVEFMKTNPHIIPNGWILNLLCYFWNSEGEL